MAQEDTCKTLALIFMMIIWKEYASGSLKCHRSFLFIILNINPPWYQWQKMLFSLFIIWQQKKDIFTFQSSRESDGLERKTNISAWDFGIDLLNTALASLTYQLQRLCLFKPQLLWTRSWELITHFISPLVIKAVLNIFMFIESR